MLLNVFSNGGETVFRAGIEIPLGTNHIGEGSRIRYNVWDTNDAAYICTAVANENTYSERHAYFPLGLTGNHFSDFRRCPRSPDHRIGHIHGGMAEPAPKHTFPGGAEWVAQMLGHGNKTELI